MLKVGVDTLEKALIGLLNWCLEKGSIPDSWRNVKVAVLFKRVDCMIIEKSMHSSLLSVLYKLLTKIITNLLTQKSTFINLSSRLRLGKGMVRLIK